VKLVDRVRLPRTALRVVELSRRAFEARNRADTEVRKRVRIAIEALNHKLGLSLKDTADLLGVSRQRVHQILKSPPPRN